MFCYSMLEHIPNAEYVTTHPGISPCHNNQRTFPSKLFMTSCDINYLRKASKNNLFENVSFPQNHYFEGRVKYLFIADYGNAFQLKSRHRRLYAMRLLSCIVVGGTREHLCNGLGRSGQLRISLITQMCKGRTLRALSCWCLVQPSVNLTFQHLVMACSVQCVPL